ncbi:MAG: hypothetical protein ABIJ56_07360 [Pseudomonadota bacterium]
MSPLRILPSSCCPLLLLLVSGCIIDLHKGHLPPPGDADSDHTPDDTAEEPGATQCSDGIDNDSDGLVDMEDYDCADSSDPLEGPESGECTNDGHCSTGMDECDRETGTCYDPPGLSPCDTCSGTAECGDGLNTGDPDADVCYSMGGPLASCGKDCLGDYDCPSGFLCYAGPELAPNTTCIPVIGTCDALFLLWTDCDVEEDCEGGLCNDGKCTSRCTRQHDCLYGYICIEGWCISR